MNELNVALVAVGGLVLLIGLVSDLFRRTWWTSEPLTAFVCGILLGPAVFGLLHPDRWGLAQEELIEQSARLTLAIGLMGVALRLPKNYAFRHWRSLRGRRAIASSVPKLLSLRSGISSGISNCCSKTKNLGSHTEVELVTEFSLKERGYPNIMQYEKLRQNF